MPMEMTHHQQKTPAGEVSNNYKVKLMVSYGGRIQAKPHQVNQLTYAGGDTKILTVDRNINLRDICAKINSLCGISNNNAANTTRLKYQLPGQDLDALVSLFDDDDVENMMLEYDYIYRKSTKPARLRLFLFPLTAPSQSAAGNLLNPDFLFGFDKEYVFPMFSGEGGSGYGEGKRVATEIQGITGNGTRDVNVTTGTGYACITPQAPLVYLLPVNAGGIGVVGNREQPVYNYVPVLPSAYEHKMGHVAGTTYCEGIAAGSFSPGTMASAKSPEA